MFKYATSQRWWFRLVDADDGGKMATGQAASITATISKDQDTFTATSQTNPTEYGTTGYYYFTLTSSETTASFVDIVAKHSNAKYKVEPMHGERYTTLLMSEVAGMTTSQAAQLSGIYTRVHGMPVVLSSTAVNLTSGNPLTIYIGSEHSSSTPLGPVTFNVSNSYNVSGWTANLKIYGKYDTPDNAVISVSGSWADTGLSTQRLEFTLEETTTDNLSTNAEYSYQVEILCGANHPYATPPGSVILAGSHS